MTWNRYYFHHGGRIGLPSLHDTPITKWFILACIGVYALQILSHLVFGDDLLIKWFALYPDRAFSRPYMFLTDVFLHSPASVYHILFNMLGIYFFAPDLERVWGRKAYVLFLFASAFLSSLACAFVYTVPVVGASGVVYAVMAAYALMWPRRVVVFIAFPVPALLLVGALVAVQLLQAAGASGATGGVAHWAHLAGAFVGAAAVLIAKGRRLKGVVPGPFLSDDKRAEMLFRKIGLHGLQSLTPEERRFLDEYASRRNGKRG